MSADGYIYCTAVSHGSSASYTSSANNPLSYRLTVRSQQTTDWSGTNPEPTLHAVHSVVRSVSVRMRYCAALPDVGSKETLTVERTDSEGNTRTAVYTGMRFAGASRNTTGRAQVAEVELEFVHESTDGTTDPETITDA